MKFFLQTILILMCSVSIGACNPMKVTDPADPNFDPDKFSFRDYGEDKDMTLSEAYRILFPPGTPKAFVERVLVDAGGIKKYGCSKYHNRCTYYYPRYMQDMKGGARIGFIFDENDKLITGSGQPADSFREIQDKHTKMIDEKIRNGEFE